MNSRTILLTIALLATIVSAQSETCLYCKRQDSTSAFMHSYSYCVDRDTCLADEIMYINQFCTTTWLNGWQVNIIEDCEAEYQYGVCEPFLSSPELYGEPASNSSRTLPPGGYCTVYIDASDAVARVTFGDTFNLGVLYNNYELGTQITIPEGEDASITIYNGSKYGPTAFVLSFSGSN